MNSKTLFYKILGFFNPELVFLIIASFTTRFFNISTFRSVVFDETYFGIFATKYLSHQYFFDIHPPLGKMLMALSAWLVGAHPGFDFSLGSSYGDFPIIAVRFFPALLGTLLVPLIYLLMRELNFSRKTAFLAGFFVLFDNAILIQSRLALLDVIMLFFIFLSLFFFLILKKQEKFSKNWYLMILICGILLGCVISVKWIGLGVVGFIWVYLITKEKILRETRRVIFIQCFFLLIVPLIVYISIFTAHLLLLNQTCSIDCGKALTYDSQKNFQYFNNRPDGGLVKNFISDNWRMLLSTLLAGQGSKHYYQSDWYSWPFMVRPILYARTYQNNKITSLYFIGNPVVWWFSFFGIIGVFYISFKNGFLRTLNKIPVLFTSDGMFFLICGYLVFFIPFSSIWRSVFIYHYLTALVFSIMIFSVFFEGITSYLSQKQAKAIYVLVLILVFLSFLFFSPFTYGLPLTEGEYQMRMWLPIWKY